MVDPLLYGRSILVVEDEYLVADDFARTLAAEGVNVLGPVPSVQEAAQIANTEPRIDAAVLDVSLRGILVFPVADILARRNVPFAFTTGYDDSIMPERFRDRQCLVKPIGIPTIIAALHRLLGGAGPAV